MSMMMLDPPEGFESQTRIYEGKRVFITFPPFHVSCSIWKSPHEGRINLMILGCIP